MECLRSDGCWFQKEKAPPCPHHPYRHCTLEPISYAVVLMDTTSYSDYSKFDPYLFDPRNYYKYGKNKYASKGVHKGMQGWICDERNIENGWLVNFPQYGEKDDIATIAIQEEDLHLLPDGMHAVVNEEIKAQFDALENRKRGGMFPTIWFECIKHPAGCLKSLILPGLHNPLMTLGPKRKTRHKGTPAKGQQKTDFAHQRGRVCGNPQALLLAHIRRGRRQSIGCPRPCYLRSVEKNDLSI